MPKLFKGIFGASPEITAIVTVRDVDVYRDNFLTSNLDSIELFTVRDSISQANSLNMGIEAAHTDLIICPHADVYLPPGWLARLRQLVDSCPEPWGVLGPAGTALGGTMYGTHSGLGMLPGHQHETAQTLDGSCLILRKSSGLRFDERFDRFHGYDADICLQAGARGLGVYVINLPIEHRSKWTAGSGFGEAYEKLAAKWKPQVPTIYTTVGTY